MFYKKEKKLLWEKNIINQKTDKVLSRSKLIFICVSHNWSSYCIERKKERIVKSYK